MTILLKKLQLGKFWALSSKILFIIIISRNFTFEIVHKKENEIK